MKIYEKLIETKDRCEVGISVLFLAVSFFCLIICLECMVVMVKHDVTTLANVLFICLLLSVNGLATFLNLTRLSNAIRARFRDYD